MKYTIKKGKHWPQWWWLRWLKLWDWPLFYGDTISYKVRFEDGCDYKSIRRQWNKLCGISIGLIPGKHSARFVFDTDKQGYSWFDLTYYTHQFYKHDGSKKRKQSEIRSLSCGIEVILTIKKYNVNGKCQLFFWSNTRLIKSMHTEIPYSKWGWKLYPWMGGEIPALKDMIIKLEQTPFDEIT